LPWDSLPQFTIHQGQPATTFVRCEIDVTTAGALRLQLADPRGLAVWVDGKPTPAAAEIPLQLAVGRHRVLFVIDRQVRQSPLQVELLDGATAVAQAQFVQGK
jgi:hypothetical protein